jgi:hypothetical protein
MGLVRRQRSSSLVHSGSKACRAVEREVWGCGEGLY